MPPFARPVIVSSACLEFKACRYNGMVIPDPFVRKLQKYAEFRPVCPECEIGLGVPRQPIRVIAQRGGPRLVQSGTEADLTDRMRRFSASYLDSLKDVDGFILKGRSPSCGIKDVKIYPGQGKVGSCGAGPGFFGGAVLERFPRLAVEDEGRLTNFTIREHFLTRIFLFARFREVKKGGTMRELVRFQSENKLLLTAYHQRELKELGRLVANLVRRPVVAVFADYEAHLFAAMSKTPRFTSSINVLMHGLGYFSEKLKAEEKAFFLKLLEDYRDGMVPLSVPVSVLRSWVVRFDEKYLRDQTFFEPYPEALVEITDSGRGRDASR